MTPSKQRMRIDPTYPILVLIILILIFIAWRQGGWARVWEGFKQGGLTLWSVTPLLLAAFFIAGLVQVLVSEEMVRRWLGRSSGGRGILLACVGGALIPGGPYVYYPITAVLLHNGASLGVMVAFVTAKNLWTLSRLPLEIALLGNQLTWVRFAATFLVPPCIGLLAEWLFGGWVERIREAVHL